MVFRRLFFTLCFFTVFQSQAQEQSEALAKQFKKYEATRAKLLDSVIDQSRHLKREQWDQSLSTGIEIDEEALRKKQNAEIKAAAQKALADSKNIYGIEIDKFRSSPEKVKSFCKKIPKGGMLHVHADGTMDRQTVTELLEEANPEVYGPELLQRVEDNGFAVYQNEREYLQSLTPSTPYSELASPSPLRELFFLPQQPYSHDFSRFMAFFFIKGIIYKGEMRYNDVTEKIYRDFLKRAQKNKVLYIEISDAQLKPKASSIKKLKKLAAIGEEFGVTVRWNISFYRNIDAKTNEEKMKKWLDYLRENPTEFIRGIDFIADESTNPALEKGQGIYAQAYHGASQGLPLHRTMHSGELGHEKNVRDAMVMGVERVGHGVKLWKDPVALEYARKIQLGIETNLVSNFRLRIVKNTEGEYCTSAFCKADHPFIKFLRLGLPVSFSTDDEGLFETTMNKECEVAITTTDIQYSELRQIAINSIETSFVDEEVKALLRERLEKELKDFEAPQ